MKIIIKKEQITLVINLLIKQKKINEMILFYINIIRKFIITHKFIIIKISFFLQLNNESKL